MACAVPLTCLPFACLTACAPAVKTLSGGLRDLQQGLWLEGAGQTSEGINVLVQVHNCAVSIPGRALGGVIEGLKKDLPDDVYGAVSTFHVDVVNLLKAGGPGKAADVEQRLKAASPGLRAAALEQGKFAEPSSEQSCI